MGATLTDSPDKQIYSHHTWVQDEEFSAAEEKHSSCPFFYVLFQKTDL